MQDPANQQPPLGRRPFWTTWTFWLLLMFATVAMVVFVGWWQVDEVVKTNIQTQLAELDLGVPTIESVSISRQGVKADNVQFFHSRDDAEPWLAVDELVINHPLNSLIAGTDHFDAIELNGVRILIDVDELLDEGVVDKTDLSDITLPADKILIQRSQLVLRGRGKNDFVAKAINVTVSGTPEILIEGAIGEMAGGRWLVSGDLSTERNTLHVSLTTDAMHLETDKWSGWPLVPDALNRSLTADGMAKLAVDLSITPDAGTVVNGQLSISGIELTLPTVGLAMQLQQGNVMFDRNRVLYENIVAELADGGSLEASAETRLAWPVTTSFQGQFQAVDVATWRRLARGIPLELRGRGSGNATGSVVVNESKRTKVQVSANATTSNASYGKIIAAAADTKVEIDQLMFDKRLIFESVNGHVTVSAEAAEQDLAHVFDTFQLGPLQSQLGIAGSGNAQLDMMLPLETVADIKTWQLSVTGALSNGLLAGQSWELGQFKGKLSDGNLVLDPIQARTVVENEVIRGTNAAINVGEPERDLAVNVRWPLVQDAPAAEVGTVAVQTNSVHPAWISKVIQNLIENSLNVPPNQFLTTLDAELNGATNADVHMTIPSTHADDLANWIATATIDDSVLEVAGQPLKRLHAKLQLEKSQLRFLEVQGAGDGSDQWSAEGFLNLENLDEFGFNARVQSLTLDRFNQIFGNLVRTGLVRQTDKLWNSYVEQLVAKISGPVDYKISVTQTGGGNNVAADWQVAVQADADELRVERWQPATLKLNFTAGPRMLDVSRLELFLDEGGRLQTEIKWDVPRQHGSGVVQWHQLPLESILEVADFDLSQMSFVSFGESTGRVTFQTTDRDLPDRDKSQLPVHVRGRIASRGLVISDVQIQPFEFEIDTLGDSIALTNFRSDDERLTVELSGKVQPVEPYAFNFSGTANALALSQYFGSNLLDDEQALPAMTGTVQGEFSFSGQSQPFDWQTTGRLQVSQPTIDNESFSDIVIGWHHLGSDWQQSKLDIEAFDGNVSLVELANQPQRIAVEIKEVDARQLTKLFKLPVELTGDLSGDASLNEWSLLETRWADLKLRGSSIIVGPAELGEFSAAAEYRNQRTTYSLTGSLLAGKLTGQGETALNLNRVRETRFPFQLTLTNATLAALYGESSYFRSLQPLEGRLAASMNFDVPLQGQPSGNGRIVVNNLKWKQKLITREASLRLNIDDERAIFDDVRFDLKRGSVAARASFPIRGGAQGNYELDVRNLDLRRTAEIFVENMASGVDGQLDARLSGQFGRTITGYGQVGIDRASLNGIAGESAKIPIEYRLSPLNQSARIELRRTRFRLFGGNASGKASIDLGPTVDLDVNLELSKVDSSDLFKSLFDVGGLDQGRLNGRLKLKGRRVRSYRDLNGSFSGQLDRVAALQLPVLNQVGRFLSAGGVMNKDYDSDEIDLRLDRGRIEVRRMNFHNSLAKIAVGGFAYLDGRLDLAVAARVERFNQPTLIDELVGSPLAGFKSTPAVFFARAADFLSDRIVFLQVSGTLDRPHVRLDSPQQLREEAVRYFLRGSSILPLESIRTN